MGFVLVVIVLLGRWVLVAFWNEVLGACKMTVNFIMPMLGVFAKIAERLV